jgi:RND family efflux transporter MFP subunit
MSKILGLLRFGSTARKIATAIVFGGVTVVLLLWLAGSFHSKIDDTPGIRAAAHARATSGRPIGSAQLVPVRTIRVPISESAVGTIRAVHETALASKLLAKVIAVDVKAGAEVRRDDILVRLDDADLRARLNQAEAAADDAEAKRDQARIEHDRIKMLLDSESASRVEFDRARTALKSAEAELRRAKQARLEAETIVSYALIRSPIDGIAVDKRVEPGDTVTPGQVLVNLYDPTRMQLDVPRPLRRDSPSFPANYLAA